MRDTELSDRDVAELAFLLANAAVISDIETEGHSVQLDGRRWYDTRPMVDEREHAPAIVDQARMALDYAHQAGLVELHREHAYLLRILGS